jgi:hypothetical protein
MITLPIDSFAQAVPYVQEQQSIPASLATQLLAKAATPQTLTDDGVAPVLVPSSGEVNKRSEVSVNYVQLTFNKDIQLGTGGKISVSQSQLMINPFVDLSFDTAYYLLISDHAVSDYAYNDLALRETVIIKIPL